MEVQILETLVPKVEVPEASDVHLATLDSEVLTLSGKLQAIAVVDQESYDQAVAYGRIVATFIGNVEELRETLTAPLYKPLNKLREAFKGILDVAEAGKGSLSRKCGSFTAGQERVRRENGRIAREEHDRQEREAKINAAVKAEEAGLKPESVARILDSPITSVAPQAAPTFQKAQGTSGRQYWKLYPSTEDEAAAFLQLVRAAAENPAAYIHLLLRNESACNKEADMKKTACKIPGYEARAEAKSAFRRL